MFGFPVGVDKIFEDGERCFCPLAGGGDTATLSEAYLEFYRVQ